LAPPGHAYAIPKGDDLVLAGDFTFQSRESPKSCSALQTYNSPGDGARELSKPSTDSVVKIEKNVFHFRWEVSGGDVRKKACFGNFGHLWPALGPNPMTHSFGSEFC